MTDAAFSFVIVTADAGAVFFAVVVTAGTVIMMVVFVVMTAGTIFMMVVFVVVTAGTIFMLMDIFTHNQLPSFAPGAAAAFFGSGLSFSHKLLLPGASMNLSPLLIFSAAC